MPKPRYKTTNWKQYNKALINRSSLTFWIDEEAIRQWKQSKQDKRGKPRQFSDSTITTALMTQGGATIVYGSSKLFHSSLPEKRLPSLGG